MENNDEILCAANAGRIDHSANEVIREQILKKHDYFSRRDKHYRWLVRVLKILVLTLTMVITILLGLRGVIEPEVQLNAALVLSAVTAFVSALSAYFNVEKYWVRNVRTHLVLNEMRDNFAIDEAIGSLTKDKLELYRSRLNSISQGNGQYWASEKRFKED